MSIFDIHKIALLQPDLRKAYGIGICSVEEIGSFAEPAPSSRDSRKLPPQPVNGAPYRTLER